MFTAKSLQLLDQNNNNISPATNIETIYYEYKDGGLVKRNHIFKHFPIYVQHVYQSQQDMTYIQNNVSTGFMFKYDTTSGQSKLLSDIFNYNEQIKGHTKKTPINNQSLNMANQAIEQQEWIKKYPDLYDTTRIVENLSDENSDSPQSEIYISGVRLRKFKNTDFKMLDISTYNLSEILQGYATNNWVRLSYEFLSTKIDNASVYHASTNLSKAITTRNIGSINASTKIEDLDGETYDNLFDQIFGLGHEPEFKPILVTATFPQLYYMQETDLAITSEDTSIIMPTKHSFKSRVVDIKDININIKYLPQLSFSYITDNNHKKYGIEKQPQDILGKQWTYGITSNSNTITSTNKYFYKDSSDSDVKIQRSVKVDSLRCGIFPDLSMPVQKINVNNELNFVFPDADKILQYDKIGPDIKKSNFNDLFTSTDIATECENWFQKWPIIIAQAYNKFRNNETKLIQSDTYSITGEENIKGTLKLPTPENNKIFIPFPAAEVMPAYPIYYGQTSNRKSMKCYWAYGNEKHKITTLMQPGISFYVAIPKIVVNQLVDPIPHLYKILQQSKWQSAVDWVIDTAICEEDSNYVLYKFVTFGSGNIRTVMFTIDFSKHNLRQYTNNF